MTINISIKSSSGECHGECREHPRQTVMWYTYRGTLAGCTISTRLRDLACDRSLAVGCWGPRFSGVIRGYHLHGTGKIGHLRHTAVAQWMRTGHCKTGAIWMRLRHCKSFERVCRHCDRREREVLGRSEGNPLRQGLVSHSLVVLYDLSSFDLQSSWVNFHQLHIMDYFLVRK